MTRNAVNVIRKLLPPAAAATSDVGNVVLANLPFTSMQRLQINHSTAPTDSIGISKRSPSHNQCSRFRQEKEHRSFLQVPKALEAGLSLLQISWQRFVHKSAKPFYPFLCETCKSPSKTRSGRCTFNSPAYFE